MSSAAGRRRFWMVVLCFALANAAAWVGFVRWEIRHRVTLRVASFSRDDGAEVGTRPTLTWTFDQDISDKVRSEHSTPGVVRPVVAGQWQWENPRTLNFTPAAELPLATAFTFILPKDKLVSSQGARLNQPYTVTIHTEPLELQAVKQVRFDERNCVVLELTFNDTVLPSEVPPHLQLHNAANQPIPFRLYGNAAGRSIRVITTSAVTTPSQKDGNLRVTLLAGLVGQSGPLGVEKDSERTLVFSDDLMATGISASAPTRGDVTLAVNLNNDVQIDLLKQVLSIEPAVPFTLSTGYDGVILHGAFEPGKRYAVKIAAAPPHDASTAYPRPTTLGVVVPDRTPGIWVEHTEGYLGSTGHRTLLAHAVNAGDLKVSVSRVYDSNLVAWRTASQRWRGDNWSVAEGLRRPIATRDLHLKPLKNHQQDVRVSLDDLLPESDTHDGVYRISLAPKRGDAVERAHDSDDDGEEYERHGDATAVVSLSDIGLSAKQGRNVISVWATSLATARPLANVHARVYSNKNQLLGEATTDADGLARVAISGVPSGEHAAVILAERIRPQLPAAASDAATQPATEAAAPDELAAAVPETAPSTAPVVVDAAENSGRRDLTWLDLSSSAVTYADAELGGRDYLRSGYEAFVYTDRGVYRPGETVHLRAIVRGVGGITPASIPIHWQFRRPDLRNWKGQTEQLDADGATSIDMPLPNDLLTGHWTAQVGLPGGENASKCFGSVTFQVEEFVPQRMKVAVSLQGSTAANDGTQPQRLPLTDQPLKTEVHADYLFGRPVTERPSKIVARIEPAPFRPAKWDGWTFGDTASTADGTSASPPVGRRRELPEAALDDKGHSIFEIDLQDLIENGEADRASARQTLTRHVALKSKTPSAAPAGADRYPGPWRLTVAASVTETGGRAVTATRQAEVDAADAYVGIRAADKSSQPGAATRFELAMVMPDGRAATDGGRTIDVSLLKESWNESLVQEHGYYRYLSTRVLEPAHAQATQLVKLAAGHGICQVTPTEPGQYVLVARDEKTGFISSLSFVAGSGLWEDTISREKPEKLELVLHPSDPGAPIVPGPLEVIVRSPFAGQLLLSIETDDVVTSRVLSMPASQGKFTINLPESAGPNAYVTASVVRPIDPNAKWRIHRAIGAQRVTLSPAERKLNLAMTLPKEIRPASSLDVELLITDSAGEPVSNAAVTVAAVDEGICQLTDFATPDPLAFFQATRALGVRTADLFSQLMPEVARPDGQSDVGGDLGALVTVDRLSPVTAPRFKPVALWSGILHTDTTGLAHTGLPVPQFTGQLRVMAVASAGKAFGSAAAPVFVRSPLLVQSSWPRFAAPGDRFSVPLTIFNNASGAGDAQVSLEWIGDEVSPLEFAATRERRLELPLLHVGHAGQATESFEVVARERIGVGHIRLIARMNDETFEETLDLPVRPASPEINVGGYATATPGKACSLELPGGMLPGTTRTRVRVTPSPLLQLPEGLEYLDRYPHGCAEQTTSTLFPLVYLPDIGARIAPDLFSRERVADKVDVGITRLIGMQTADGGLAMWPGSSEDWPWASVYAAHFLVEAKAAGYPVPPEFARNLMHYVHGQLSRTDDAADTLQTQAYACYVLALSGQPDRPAMSRLGEQLNAAAPAAADPGGTARFDLAAAWLAAGRRDLATGLIPKVIPSPREERALNGALGSPVRDRAIVLTTLLAVSPDNPAIPGLVEQLASQGRQRGWRSTQDTAFAVMAIGRYLRQSKPATPYESADLLQGDAVAAHVDANGVIDWAAPNEPGHGTTQPSALHVQVTGPADTRAFVSWSENGVPLHPPADADQGMTVRRQYFDSHEKPIPVDQPLHTGDAVIVELTLSSTSPLSYVVIEDLLPAGLEVENPRLVTSAAVPKETPPDAAGSGFNQSRLDVRDDRIIVVGDLPGGTCTYRYLVRATSPGVFAAPPVKAECMYDLGTTSIWGAGRTIRVVAPGDAAMVDTR